MEEEKAFKAREMENQPRVPSSTRWRLLSLRIRPHRLSRCCRVHLKFQQSIV